MRVTIFSKRPRVPILWLTDSDVPSIGGVIETTDGVDSAGCEAALRCWNIDSECPTSNIIVRAVVSALS